MARYLQTMVPITDPKRSRDFYEALGFTFRPTTSTSSATASWEATNYFFSIGDQESVPEPTYNQGRPKRTTSAPGAATSQSASATSTARSGSSPSRASSRSGRPTQVVEGGSRICFVRDPDDYRIELIERR